MAWLVYSVYSLVAVSQSSTKHTVCDWYFSGTNYAEDISIEYTGVLSTFLFVNYLNYENTERIEIQRVSAGRHVIAVKFFSKVNET